MKRVTTEEELQLVAFFLGWVIPATRAFFIITIATAFLSGLLAGVLPSYKWLPGAVFLPTLSLAYWLTVHRMEQAVHKVTTAILAREEVLVILQSAPPVRS